MSGRFARSKRLVTDADKAEESRVLESYVRSFDSGPTAGAASFVRASTAARPGEAYRPTPSLSAMFDGSVVEAPKPPKKKREIDSLLDELKSRNTMRGLGVAVDEPAPAYAPAPVPRRDEGVTYSETTNLMVANLAQTVTEEKLNQLFGQFGEVFSVKVMWPRSDEERRRRNRGFVSFVKREDAADALAALDNAAVDGVRVQVQWGKALRDAPQPQTMIRQAPPPRPAAMVFSFGGPKLPAAPAPEAAPPTPAPQPAPAAAPLQSGKASRWDSGPGSAAAPAVISEVLAVIPPADPFLRAVIDQLAAYVAADGRPFEESVRAREANNPLFRFCVVQDAQDTDTRYYRWRVWRALMQAASPEPPGANGFQMQRGGALFVPPLGDEDEDAVLEAQPQQPEPANDDESARYAARGTRAGEAMLFAADARGWAKRLASATPSRKDVAGAMLFALDYADAAHQIAGTLNAALLDGGAGDGELGDGYAETPAAAARRGARLLARLYVVSDVLHNSSSQSRGARAYRHLLRPALPAAFDALGAALRAAHGRAGLAVLPAAEAVTTLLATWLRWSHIFSPMFVFGLESTFLERLHAAETSPNQLSADDAETQNKEPHRAGIFIDARLPPDKVAQRLARSRRYVKHRAFGVDPHKAFALALDDDEAAAVSEAGAGSEASGEPRAAGPATGAPAFAPYDALNALNTDAEDVDGEEMPDDAAAPPAARPSGIRFSLTPLLPPPAESQTAEATPLGFSAERPSAGFSAEKASAGFSAERPRAAFRTDANESSRRSDRAESSSKSKKRSRDAKSRRRSRGRSDSSSSESRQRYSSSRSRSDSRDRRSRSSSRSRDRKKKSTRR